MADNKCKYCKFFECSDKFVGSGYCHRFPPIVKDYTIWPSVNELDYCGEFKRFTEKIKLNEDL